MKCPEHNSLIKLAGANLKLQPMRIQHLSHTTLWLSMFVLFTCGWLIGNFLERCTLGATQNQNESFNNVVWLRASKTQFLGLPTVELAASTAVLDFNEGKEVGMKNLFEHLGVEFKARAQVFFLT